MATKEVMKTVYDGVDVIYNESKDRWEFELRGRERHASTLGLAKKAIDAPATEKNTFTRFKAYMEPQYSYGRERGEYDLVEVTSEAQRDTSYSGREFWVQDAEAVGKRERNRRKVAGYKLKAFTPVNATRIAAMKSHGAEIIKLQKAMGELENQLDKADLPAEEKE